MTRYIIPIGVLYLFFSCSNKEETIHPTEEKIIESVYASGIIKSKNQYQVYSTTNAIIKEVFVTEGDIVKKGDPLFQLSDEKALLNKSSANIAAEYTTPLYNADKLAELKLDIETAKARMENDASLLDKQRNLWNEGIGTKNELQQRELNYSNSSNNYNAAQLRFNQIEKQLKLQAKQSKTNIAIANSNTNDFIIKSEFNGKIYSILKKKGEMASTITPIALIGASNSFIIEMQVDEYDITNIQLGQKIIVSMDSYKEQVFEAMLTKINPSMNAQTKSFTVEAIFNHPPTSLFPNLTTEANIIIHIKEHALTIPRSYLLNNEFVILANKERRKVIIGLKDYQKVEILKGLSLQDEIVKPAQ